METTVCPHCKKKWRYNGMYPCPHECSACGGSLIGNASVTENGQNLKVEVCGCCKERFSVSILPLFEEKVVKKKLPKNVRPAPFDSETDTNRRAL